MDEDKRLTNADHRLLGIIWESEPVGSPELCKLAESRLGWKRTTTYTVLKRLGDRGFVKNANAVVSSLVSRDDVAFRELDCLIKRGFDDSLPAFLTAFTSRKRLSEAEITELQKLIDESRGR